MTSTLLLVDGHSVAFRAFYAMSGADFTTTTGEPVGAVYGFVNMLLSQLEQHRPTHVAAAFDASRHSFRTDIYPAYKAGRGETPEEFKGQVPLIQDVLAALGIRYFEEPDVEADDVLATLATKAADAGLKVLVMSGDRDTFQLVDQNVSVLYPQGNSRDVAVITPEEVFKRYGVQPAEYPDLAALVGEQSDNLPGVPKVGKVTAAKWITEYGDLAGIGHHQAQLKGVVGENLRQHFDQVLVNRQLNELRRDVPLEGEVDTLRLGSINRAELDLLFASLQFGRIKDRILKSGVWGKDATQVAPQSPATVFRPIVVGEGGLQDFLEDYPGVTTGLDVAGRLRPGSGEAWKAAFAYTDGRVTELELSNLDQANEEALVNWCEDAEAAKAVHGAKSASQMLYGNGIELDGVVFDTEVAAYLLWPDQRGYDLPGLTQRLLGVALGAGPDDANVQGVLDFGDESSGLEAAGRADAVARLVEPLTKELEDRGAVGLLVELEQPLTKLLVKMERVGIAVDEERLRNTRAELAGRVELAEHDAIAAIGGRQVNLGSPKAIQDVLFNDLQMPKTRRTKTGYSTDAGSLAELFTKSPHPFLEHLLAHRDAIKLRQMVDSLLAAIQDDARIHTTFGQTVAATGRLSSSDPNLQNIPTRSQVGREIRHSFVVGRGYAELMSADYSQIEMRIMADLSGDQALIDAFNEGEDLHRSVAARVFGGPPDEVTSEQRSKIKAMSYGLAYGLSAYGLSKQLGISQGEAEDLRNDYFSRFGGIRDYLEGVVRQARRDGYTQTILGRRRYLPDLTSENRQRREMA
jgi:DNA polymerase-1